MLLIFVHHNSGYVSEADFAGSPELTFWDVYEVTEESDN